MTQLAPYCSVYHHDIHFGRITPLDKLVLQTVNPNPTDKTGTPELLNTIQALGHSQNPTDINRHLLPELKSGIDRLTRQEDIQAVQSGLDALMLTTPPDIISKLKAAYVRTSGASSVDAEQSQALKLLNGLKELVRRNGRHPQTHSTQFQKVVAMLKDLQAPPAVSLGQQAIEAVSYMDNKAVDQFRQALNA